MFLPKGKTLALTPFPFLPPRTGGEWCAFYANAYLARETQLWVATAQEWQGEHPFAHAFSFPDNKWKYLNPALCWQLSGFMKREQIGALLLHQPFMAPLAWAACRISGARLYIYAHNLEYARFRSLGKWWHRLLFFWEKWAFQRAQGVFFVSEEDIRQAVQELGIAPQKCFPAPFGTPFLAQPLIQEAQARQEIGLQPDEKGLLFVGSMDYQPNQEAVRLLVEKVMPLLATEKVRLFICGRHLPLPLQESIAQSGLPIAYKGFVPDLSPYFQACSAFPNPVLLGGGVKTKVVEALSWGLPVVSTQTGAQGIPLQHCEGKLLIVQDGNWEDFAGQLRHVLGRPRSSMSPVFYDAFSWEKIASRMWKWMDGNSTMLL